MSSTTPSSSAAANNRSKAADIAKALPQPEVTSETANLFKALSDPTRLRIVQVLLLDELCVHDISAIVDISVSAISHQLRLLRNMKIVKTRKSGKNVFYTLDDEHIAKLVQIAQEHVTE